MRGTFGLAGAPISTPQGPIRAISSTGSVNPMTDMHIRGRRICKTEGEWARAPAGPGIPVSQADCAEANGTLELSTELNQFTPMGAR